MQVSFHTDNTQSKMIFFFSVIKGFNTSAQKT